MVLKKLSLLLLLVPLSACNSWFEHNLEFGPTVPVDVPPPPKTLGRIYQPGYELRLYQDRTACRVGDILTVRLEESTQGQYKSTTKTDKKQLLDYPMPTVFGKKVPAMTVETNTEQKLDSTGNSDQSNKLIGTISVTVRNILANGNLVIQGESWVTINQGKEYVQISGVVRPEDILANNVVSSQRVAAANIIYGAAGEAGYATRGGYAFRIFNRFGFY